jgi:hypothetical protein
MIHFKRLLGSHQTPSNYKNKVLKRIITFNEITPSKELNIDEYEIFLRTAKEYELELDVISQETYYKICKQLNNPLPKPNPPQSRLLNF